MFFVKNNVVRKISNRKLFVLNIFKIRNNQFLQFVYWAFANNYQAHQVAWIILLVKIFNLLINVFYFQSFKASSWKPIEPTSGNWNIIFLYLRYASRLFTDIFFILVVNCVHFSVNSTLAEYWLFEKLRKNINSFIKMLIFDIEIIISVIFSCWCVAWPSMLLYKLLIVVFVWVFLSSHK